MGNKTVIMNHQRIRMWENLIDILRHQQEFSRGIKTITEYFRIICFSVWIRRLDFTIMEQE
jgi:hypothetical protein